MGVGERLSFVSRWEWVRHSELDQWMGVGEIPIIWVSRWELVRVSELFHQMRVCERGQCDVRHILAKDVIMLAESTDETG